MYNMYEVRRENLLNSGHYADLGKVERALIQEINWIANEDGLIVETGKDLAERLGYQVNSINRARKSLVQYGYLTPVPSHSRKTSVYIFNSHGNVSDNRFCDSPHEFGTT